MKNNKNNINNPKPLPSVKELNEVISYDPLTGVCRWKKPPIEKFKIGDPVGWLTNAGYVQGMVLDGVYLMHRIAYKMHFGYDPQIVDHINGVRNDNRICNLRDVTHTENMQNRINSIKMNNWGPYTPGCRKRKSKKKVKGVCYDRKHKCWKTHVMVNGKTRFLGRFECKALAGITYMLAKHHIKAHGAI